MSKLGVGYQQQRARRPEIVYCQYTGYGATGPYATIPTHGQMMNAAAGATLVEMDDAGFVRPYRGPQPFNGIASGGKAPRRAPRSPRCMSPPRCSNGSAAVKAATSTSPHPRRSSPRRGSRRLTNSTMIGSPTGAHCPTRSAPTGRQARSTSSTALPTTSSCCSAASSRHFGRISAGSPTARTSSQNPVAAQ